jgi:AcrR family transcriptional regulator
MSSIASGTGIGRATLYRYFADVDAILDAWHERTIGTHLAQLEKIRDSTPGAQRRLAAVLHGYASMSAHREVGALAASLHRAGHVVAAQRQLHALVSDLIEAAVRDGEVRDDVAPRELAGFCLHALTAASSLPSRAAVDRLVTITLDALRPPPR